jgi:DNA-binding IclR family transcriptional regulator
VDRLELGAFPWFAKADLPAGREAAHLDLLNRIWDTRYMPEKNRDSVRAAARKAVTSNPAAQKYGSPAVVRALDIMVFMANHPRSYGATELSRCLKIPKNTVSRILLSLAEREFAVQDAATGGYQLGTRVFTLGMSLYTRFELRRRARSHLEWLCRETQETCQIHVPHGDKVLVLDTVSPDVQFYFRVVPGGLLDYHPNAFGKCILAFRPVEEVRKILPVRMEALTPNTIVLRSEFLAQLEETRKTGLAYDNEEYIMGVFCIGAPVFDAEGNVVAGMGITGLMRTRASFEQEVLTCAFQLSKDIGYTGSFFTGKIKDRP